MGRPFASRQVAHVPSGYLFVLSEPWKCQCEAGQGFLIVKWGYTSTRAGVPLGFNCVRVLLSEELARPRFFTEVLHWAVVGARLVIRTV